MANGRNLSPISGPPEMEIVPSGEIDLRSQSSIEIVPDSFDQDRTPLDEDTVQFKATETLLAQARINPNFAIDSQEMMIETLKNRIRKGEEEQIRQELLAEKAQRQIDMARQVLVDLGPTPSQEDREAAINVLTGMNLRSDNIIEEEASAALVESGASDPIRAKVMTDEPDEVDQTQLFLYKAAVVDRLLTKHRKAFEQQGFTGDAIDVMEMLIPFGVEIFERRRTGGEVFSFTSDNIQDWRLRYLAMDKDTFDREIKALDASLEDGGLFGPNRILNQSLLASLRSFKASDEALADLGLVFDTASVLPIGTAVKFIKGGATATRVAGNRAAAATITEAGSEALQGTTQAMTRGTVEDIYHNALPSNVQTQNLIGPNVSGEVAKRLEEKAAQRAALGREVLDAPKVSRLNEDQINLARSEADNRLRNAAGENFVIDVGTEINPVNNVETRIAYIGQVKDKNAGFVTEAGARRSAQNRGFLLPDFDVVRRSGQYFIALKEPVVETGQAVRRMGKIDPSKIPAVNRLQRFLQGADSLLDTATRNRRHLAAGIQARINQLLTQHTRDLRSIGRQEKRNLNNALQASEQRQKWMNTDELEIFWRSEDGLNLGRGPTEKELNAYFAAKDLNDLDWFLHNSDLHARLSRDGFKKIEITMGKLKFDDHAEGKFVGNAKIYEDIATRAKERNAFIYDASSGRMYRPGTLTPDETARLEADGWRLLEVQNSEDLYKGVGSPVKYVLAHPNDYNASLIDFVQLPYVEGGHRIYQGSFFIKQGRTLVDAGTGSQYLMRPLTHFVAQTRGEATEIAQRWETARKAYTDVIAGRLNEGEATRIIQENTNLRDFAHFSRLVDEGSIDAKNKFEAVFDRQLPSIYSGRDADFLGAFDEADDLHEWMNTSGRLIYGRKGERLRDEAGDFAQTVDAYDAMGTGIKHAISTRAFADLTRNVTESWASTFRKYLEDFPSDWSPIQIMNRGTFRADAPEAIKAKGEAMRATHLQLLNTPTKASLWYNETIRQLADKIEEIGGTRGRTIARFVHNTKSRDPITALRSLAFDLKLGLFDPSQILIQSQTAFAALSLDTVNGGRAFLSYAPLRYALHNGSEEFVDYIAKNWKSLHGLDPEDFKDLYSDLRRSGMADISGNLAILDELSSTHFVNLATNPIARLRELGRVPFFEGERINRIVAFTIAWRRFRKANPGVKVTDRIMESLRQEADVFAVNMDRASNAWWQRGLLSVPTQFLSYQARLMELMLPKMLGGSPNLRAQQKLRLALGQFALYGTAGIPLAGYVKNKFEKATGEELTPEVEKALFQGFWDNVIFGTLGMDTDFSARAGIAGGRNLFSDIIEGRSLLEIASGPALTVASDTTGTLLRLMQLRHLSLEDAARVTPSLMNEIAKNAATWSRATRAWYALKTGQYLSSRSGSVIIQDVNPQEAVALLLGIPLDDVNNYYEMKQDLHNQDRRIQEAADFVSRRLGEMYRQEVAGANRDADATAKLISVFLQPFDGNERGRIISIATKNASTDLADVMEKYLESFGYTNLIRRSEIKDGSED